LNENKNEEEQEERKEEEIGKGEMRRQGDEETGR
jgi:hypothetical protein